jgi:hypothetical protein
VGELVQPLARELEPDVEGAALLLLDVGEVDRDVRDEGQVDLRRLGPLLHPLHRDGGVGEVDLVLAPEVLEDVVDDPVVEVHAPEEGVAAGGEHLEDVPRKLQHGHVEGPAAEIVDEHLLVEPAGEAVGEGRGGRLVHDPLHVEAGERARLAHRLPLRVGVVGGNGDDRLADLLLEEGLGDLLHVGEHHRAHLGEGRDLSPEQHRGVARRPLDDVVRIVVAQLLDDLRVPLAADEPLRAVDRVLGVRDELVLRVAVESL